MFIAAACLLLVAGASGTAPSPSLEVLRPEAERILRDFGEGRLEAVEARFVEALRPKVKAARASLAAQRAELGAFVRVEDARLFTAARVAGHPVTVLDADVKFAKTPAFAELGFVNESGQWRLHGFTVAVADDRPPLDDARAPAAAKALLDDARRRGLVVLFEAIPPVARDKDWTDAELRAMAQRPEALLGKLRTFRQGDMEFAWNRCRTLPAEAVFDRGQGTVSLSLCPSGGAWRPFQVEVEPVMTPALFETMVRDLVARELRLPAPEVRCPASLVPIGDTVTCELTRAGRKLRVRRAANSHIEVETLP
jgi:hypothetical protein